MADAAGSSDPAKDSTKPDRTLNSTKVGNSDSQTPDCLCSSTKLRKNRKSHFKSTILWTARRCFLGVGRSNHIVQGVSKKTEFSRNQLWEIFLWLMRNPIEFFSTNPAVLPWENVFQCIYHLQHVSDINIHFGQHIFKISS